MHRSSRLFCLIAPWVLLFGLPAHVAAQQGPAQAGKPAESAKPAVASPAASAAKQAPAKPAIELDPDEKGFMAAQRVSDPQERLQTLIKLVGDYPQYPYIRNVVYYLFRDPTRSIRERNEPQKRDPQATKLLVDTFVAGTQSATAYARAEFYYGIANNLAGSDLLLEDAAALARKAIPLLNEADYVANERRKWERKERYTRLRDPQAHVDPYSLEEAKAHYRMFAAAANATLGTALLKLGKLDEARQAFLQASAIEPVMEATTGLADIAERRGNTEQALSHLMDALLTGKLTAARIAHLEELYAKTHGGKPEGLQAELDRRFRARFRSPLEPVRYQPRPDRSRRVALAEFVTGAGCEPCTSVDLAFEAALRRYTRDELALIVYHMHAPTSDPMSNMSAEERFKYYDVHAAPTVILDGRKITPGEGMKSEAARVYDALDREIAARLVAPDAARIALDAVAEDGAVKVTAVVQNVQETGHPLRLHLALVENEVSYSGENGLRFHPMVVRNLAHPNPGDPAGFAVPAGPEFRARYAFDLKQIVADNLKYYDWYIDDLFKRVGLRPSFKEKRNLIDEASLSVVAFVQDDTTREVLQARYVRVPAARAETSAAAR